MTEDVAARVRELQLQVSGLEERLEDMAVKRSDAEERVEQLQQALAGSR